MFLLNTTVFMIQSIIGEIGNGLTEEKIKEIEEVVFADENVVLSDLNRKLFYREGLALWNFGYCKMEPRLCCLAVKMIEKGWMGNKEEMCHSLVEHYCEIMKFPSVTIDQLQNIETICTAHVQNISKNKEWKRTAQLNLVFLQMEIAFRQNDFYRTRGLIPAMKQLAEGNYTLSIAQTISNFGSRVAHSKECSYEEAVLFFEESATVETCLEVPEDKFSYELFLSLSICYFHLQKFQQSLQWAKRANMIHETQETFLLLFNGFLKCKKEKEAEEAMNLLHQRITQDSPVFFWTLEEFMMAFPERGCEAIKFLVQKSNDSTFSSRNLRTLLKVYLLQKRFHEAKLVMQQIIQINDLPTIDSETKSSIFEIVYNHAAKLLNKGNFVDGNEWANLAEILNDNMNLGELTRVLRLKMTLNLKENKLQEALVAGVSAFENDPTDVHTTYMLFVVYSELNDFEKAKTTVQALTKCHGFSLKHLICAAQRAYNKGSITLITEVLSDFVFPDQNDIQFQFSQTLVQMIAQQECKTDKELDSITKHLEFCRNFASKHHEVTIQSLNALFGNCWNVALKYFGEKEFQNALTLLDDAYEFITMVRKKQDSFETSQKQLNCLLFQYESKVFSTIQKIQLHLSEVDNLMSDECHEEKITESKFYAYLFQFVFSIKLSNHDLLLQATEKIMTSPKFSLNVVEMLVGELIALENVNSEVVYRVVQTFRNELLKVSTIAPQIMTKIYRVAFQKAPMGVKMNELEGFGAFIRSHASELLLNNEIAYCMIEGYNSSIRAFRNHQLETSEMWINITIQIMNDFPLNDDHLNQQIKNFHKMLLKEKARKDTLIPQLNNISNPEHAS